MPILQDDTKLRVQQSTDVVRLIGEHVALRPRGKEFIGLCPFHDDKNPSMYVSPAKQIYKCFACGAGGDVFSFVIAYHKMTFPEALRYLADRAGIKIPERHRDGAGADAEQGPTDRQRMLQAHEQAAGFFRSVFQHAEHGKRVRDYVASRKISPPMIEAFQIGYAPDRWDGMGLMIASQKWDTPAFVMAGLVMPRNRDNGSRPTAAEVRPADCYDRFRHRLMFPICDAIGRVIAFGGRKLRPEDEPKYLNSPESPLFNKSATLYGLHLAKKAIIDSRTAVIVEGYTDVIACHQHGCRNVVSTLGTALTPQHVGELRRYCEKVVLIYDGDAAGIKAMDRAVEVFLNEGLDVALAVIPGDLDPGDLFELPDGLDRWQAVAASAKDALEYQFDRLKQQTDGADTLTGRQKLVEDYLRRLAQLGLGRPGQAGIGMVRRAMVMQKIAELLRIPEKAVSDLLHRLAPPSGPQVPRHGQDNDSQELVVSGADNPANTVAFSGRAHRLKALRVAEQELIGCLLREPGLFHQTYVEGRPLDEALTPADLVSPQAARLYDALYSRLAEGGAVTLAGLLADLAEQGQTELAALATAAESEVEAKLQAPGGEARERIQGMLVGAAQALLGHQKEEAYRRTREGAGAAAPRELAAGDVEGQVARRLRELQAHLTANPSPTRVAVVKARE